MENKKTKQLATTYSEILERFREYNIQHCFNYNGKCHDDSNVISAVIVYDQSNFTEQYTELQRSYRVNNFSGKMFFPGLCGTSVFGDCLDGSEECIRLDMLPWKIERCYFESDIMSSEKDKVKSSLDQF